MSGLVLGVTAFTHDASCALLNDGRIVAMAEEERFDRVKHSAAFPENAIRYCLREAGASFAELSRVGFFWNPDRELHGNLRHFLRYFPSSFRLLGGGEGEDGFFLRQRRMRRLPELLRERFGSCPPFRFEEHHLCHAASAFFPSPFEEAAILTIDGRGESTSTMISAGTGERIRKLVEVPVPHSLGHLFAAITEYLGFRAFSDEWKVMGMSAYGTPALVDELSRLLVLLPDPPFYRLDLSYFRFHTHGRRAWLSPKFFREFGPPRGRGVPWAQPDFDLAFALQRVLERAGVHLARKARELTGARHLCLAGGVTLNCLMNRAILGAAAFDGHFLQPIANDAGCSLGAALLLSHAVPGNGCRDRQRFPPPYFGPAFSEEEILPLLREQGVFFRRSPDVVRDAAELLSRGLILGWFQGRMESGPRALGNRSILADPAHPGMKDRLNARVKHRESFRPFAPAVTVEAAARFFSIPGSGASPHMLLVGDVRDEWRERLPAVTHRDGTARVQTVSREDNPLFHRLLEEFGRRKGVPVLVNTSFNDREPIVCTPGDALSCFQRTDLDVLILGSFVVEKRAPGEAPV